MKPDNRDVPDRVPPSIGGDGQTIVSLDRLTLPLLRQLFALCGDVNIHPVYTGDDDSRRTNPILVYCDGMIDRKERNEFVYRTLDRLLADTDAGDAEPLRCGVFAGHNLYRIAEPHGVQNLTEHVLSGNLVLFFESRREAYVVQMSAPPQREPSESSTEISIKGPRDGFTESTLLNVALVRKRVKSATMAVEYFYLGARSRTAVAFLFIKDVTAQPLVEEVRKRLRKIDVDIVASSQLVEEAISDKSWSLFPLIEYIGRPDHVAESLMRGRVAVIVDGSPMVLVAPATLTNLIKSPEDLHLPFYYVSLERLLRLAGIAVSMLLPGFWVALSSFNLDQIPYPLLATIVISRLGLPLTGPFDLWIMLGMFELFREAGMRLPKAVGQTVAVVGGLIVGNAAIAAGITGPTTLVASAATAVSTFTLINQALSGSVTIIRYLVLTFCCLFGMLGFFLSLFLLVTYLATLTSFGTPFLSPLSPLKLREALTAVISLPWKNQQKRAQHAQDPTRQGAGKP